MDFLHSVPTESKLQLAKPSGMAPAATRNFGTLVEACLWVPIPPVAMRKFSIYLQ
jgi:hypothetical protein